MRRRAVLPALLTVALLAAAAGLWWGRDSGRVEGPEEPPAPRPGAELEVASPLLVGAPRGSGAQAPAPPLVPEPGPEAVEDADEEKAAPRRPPLTLRLVDARGQPIAYARVVARTSSGEASDETSSEGVATLELPEGDLQSLEILGPDSGAPRTLLTLSGREALERLAKGPLGIEDLLHLLVRTVDRRGDPRPDQRILYRVLPEGAEAQAIDSVWGDTTNAQAQCRLGPFRAGTKVGLRPGPRGEGNPFSLVDWRTVVVDGTPVDVDVGDAPRLRLSLAALPAQESVRLAVLDPESGEALFPWERAMGATVWTAPALAKARVDVLVGPTADGRYARLRDVAPDYEPIEVTLRAGAPVAGRAGAPGLRTPVKGTVHAHGRGFEFGVDVAPDGTFRFPGLPDESLTLLAEITDPAGGAWHGTATRGHEREVHVPLLRSIRLSGQLVALDDKFEPRRGQIFVDARIQPEAVGLPKPNAITSDASGHFSATLPTGRWRLEAVAHDGDGELLVGSLDLGEVDAPRDDLVLVLVSLR